MPLVLRITTVPISLHLLLKGQLRYMQDHGMEVIAASAAGEEVQYVTNDGIKHYVIPFTRRITPIQDIVCLLKLISLIKKVRPDIVHTHTPKAGLLGMLAAWICKVPVRLHTVAGLPLTEKSGGMRALLEKMEKVTYACAHCVYPNSLGLNEFILEKLHINPRKIKIIGRGSSNGIDSNFFCRTEQLIAESLQLRDRLGIQQNDYVICFVGRIVKDKGIVELVTAFRKLLHLLEPKGKRAFLLLVGPFEQDLDPLPAEIITFLQSDKRVVLPGFQSDVRPWMIAGDIFVFPSYREGFPNVVMQASLLEVPCIVSDINGCNEIITNNETGLLIPSKNVPALVNAMSTLLKDDSRRTKLALAARKFIVANYEQNYVWQQLRLEYEKILIERNAIRPESGVL